MQVLDTYQYPESNGEFERPPYCVLVKSINSNTGGKFYDLFCFPYLLSFRLSLFFLFLLPVFTWLSSDLPEFFLVGIHTRPSDADIELNFLDDALFAAGNAFETTNGMILGDFNADCSYVSQTKFDLLDLVVDTSLTWWIDSDTDTTTGNSDCSYDRYMHVHLLGHPPMKGR